MRSKQADLGLVSTFRRSVAGANSAVILANLCRHESAGYSLEFEGKDEHLANERRV